MNSHLKKAVSRLQLPADIMHKELYVDALFLLWKHNDAQSWVFPKGKKSLTRKQA
jgi:hypothetical protein